MKDEKIPDLYLEQLVLGELPEERKREISTQHQKELDGLRLSNEEILKKYPPSRMIEKINTRLAAEAQDSSNVVEARGWFTPRRTGMLLAAAVFAIIAGISPVLFKQDSTAADAPVEMTRIKGMEPSISLYRNLSGSVEELKNGARAQERDLLQISYNSAGRLYGVIFSIDGRGIVTLHHPSAANGSILLERNGDIALDFSYQLDDAPVFERFFFITSDTSFTIDTVLNAAKVFASELVETNATGMKGSLDLPEELEQKSLTLQKEVSK